MTRNKSTIIRQAVLDELSRRGWSVYQLVKELQSHRDPPAESTVYHWLAGDHHISDHYASQILSCLDLTIS